MESTILAYWRKIMAKARIITRVSRRHKVSIALPLETYDQLLALEKETGENKSSLCRNAITALVTGQIKLPRNEAQERIYE